MEMNNLRSILLINRGYSALPSGVTIAPSKVTAPAVVYSNLSFSPSGSMWGAKYNADTTGLRASTPEEVQAFTGCSEVLSQFSASALTSGRPGTLQAQEGASFWRINYNTLVKKLPVESISNLAHSNMDVLIAGLSLAVNTGSELAKDFLDYNEIVELADLAYRTSIYTLMKHENPLPMLNKSSELLKSAFALFESEEQLRYTESGSTVELDIGIIRHFHEVIAQVDIFRRLLRQS